MDAEAGKVVSTRHGDSIGELDDDGTIKRTG